MSELNIDELLRKINELEAELKTAKKYGLVWDKEHTQEEVVEQCQTLIPVLKPISEKNISNGGQNNIIIEGDNFHSLSALNFVLKNQIDIIYIDPPYNTGNEDFVYNDKFVNSDDGYKHSKWLSFMSRRLKLARDLLNDSGCIFLSIDDNEQANLKLLCDSIFGESNFIACICRQAIKGGSRSVNIKTVHDYVLIYAKSFNNLTTFTGHEKEAMVLNLEDEKGPYARGRELNKWGAGSRREDSPTMWFPIKGPNGEDVYPIRNDGSEGRWRWGKTKLLKAVEDGEVIFEPRGDGTYIVYEKVRGNKNTTDQFNTWFADNYINAKGSEAVKKVFGTMMSVFDYAKPVELISELLFMANNKNALVLDFFAGSGTTGQAVLELNKADSGKRRFILCTNNENRICEDITYPRIKTVITGKRKDGSAYSEGTPASLYYFKTDFVRDESNVEQAKYSLVERVDSLICILENIFIEVEMNDYSSHYTDGRKHLFIYNEYFNEKKFSEFKNRVKKTSGNKIVYVFSSDNEIDPELINEDNVVLKPIPSKIYEIYKEISESIKRGE